MDAAREPRAHSFNLTPTLKECFASLSAPSSWAYSPSWQQRPSCAVSSRTGSSSEQREPSTPARKQLPPRPSRSRSSWTRTHRSQTRSRVASRHSRESSCPRSKCSCPAARSTATTPPSSSQTHASLKGRFAAHPSPSRAVTRPPLRANGVPFPSRPPARTK